MSTKRLTRADMEAEFPLGLWAEARVRKYLDGKPEPLRWAFRNYFPRGKVTLLAGAGGSSKSFFTLHMGIHMVLAEPFGPLVPSARPGKALLIMGEEDRNDIHRRINAIERQRGFTDDDWAVMGEQLRIASVRGQDWRLVYHDEAGDLQEHPCVDALINEINEVGNIHLIGFDPLVVFNGGRENDNVEMARFMYVLDRIASETGAAVVVIHHVSKAGQVTNLDGVAQSVIRGASALVDNARCAILLTKMPRGDAPAYNIQPDDAGRFVVMRVVKNNYGPHTEDAIFEVGEGGTLTHAPHVRRVFSSPAQAERAVQSKASAYQLLLAMSQYPGATQRELEIKTRISKSHIQRLQLELLEDRYLRRTKTGKPKYEVTERGRMHVSE